MSNAPRTPRYVQVNIGRNVGEEAMDYRLWAQFKHDLELAIIYASVPPLNLVQVHEGIGAWINEDGITVIEESAHLSTFADVDLFKLRTELARLKREYQQDAIALIAGSDLI